MSESQNDIVAQTVSKVRANWPAFYAKLSAWFIENWIKVGGLTLSATQTWFMVGFFAPVWAWWLPLVAVIIMEGGVAAWQYREEEADAADTVTDAIDKNKKNQQELIANTMVWISLFTSGITMIAGVFLEVTQSQLAKVLMPDERLTNLLGWVSLTFIFLLVTINLYADWQYRRADPLLTMMREARQDKRRLDRMKRNTLMQGELEIAQKEAKFLGDKFSRASTRIGWKNASEAFDKATKKPEVPVERKHRVKRGDKNGLKK